MQLPSLSSGLATFTIIWSGQLASLLGTGLTRFALLLWLYEQTGQATSIALLGFFSFGASVLTSPFAGVLVDRLDRRWVLIGADTGAGLMTLLLFVLHSLDGLQVWHLYLASALTGVFEAFQIPAFTAATTMLVPKSQYARASGMRSLGESIGEIGAPLLAGTLLALIGLGGVMLMTSPPFSLPSQPCCGFAFRVRQQRLSQCMRRAAPGAISAGAFATSTSVPASLAY